MYNKSNMRQPRTNAGWKNRSRNNFRPKRGRFSGDAIDINLFINKAEPTKPLESYTPQHAFNDFPISKKIKETIARHGYSTPTPIQDKAIPVILSGHDIIGLANTGTGKTAAFLIPLINKILTDPAEKVLIVVPTRELAIQIEDEFLAFARGLHIFSVVVVGGANIQRQIRDLRMRNNVVIGTPGRLKDLIDRKVLDLSNFNNVVLDEADRMLDMGFINDVKLLLSLVAEKRQTMLFSATFSKEVENLTRQFLTNPQRISIKTRETSHLVDQDIIQVPSGQDKVDVLEKLLAQSHFEKILIFARTKHGADRLTKKLSQRGFRVDCIHGDKPHNKRQKALNLFKDNTVEILVATDVAARGLDIPKVSHVINFDLPATYEDYIHRIGRTGRADQKGTALTFVN
jgi:ATP-dependent RNA helicase RhlE